MSKHKAENRSVTRELSEEAMDRVVGAGEYLKFEMHDALISSYSISGGGGVSTESL
jgi:hypothetical protein